MHNCGPPRSPRLCGKIHASTWLWLFNLKHIPVSPRRHRERRDSQRYPINPNYERQTANLPACRRQRLWPPVTGRQGFAELTNYSKGVLRTNFKLF
jgi:hypothetical protein